MSLLRYAVPALVALGSVFAQSDSDSDSSNSCSASSTTTISSQGDASAIASCSTYSGSIAIATDVANTLSLDGNLKEIDGSLSAVNAIELNGLNSGSLQSITQTFRLTNMTRLYTLNMGSLENVGMIDWQTLPALQSLSFGDGIQNATQISIQDTQIQSLDNVNVKVAGSVNIANNGNLNSMSWQMTNVTNFTIHSNGPENNGGLNASFPNLVGAGSIQISNVSSLVLSSLANVGGLFTVYGSSINELMLPNMTKAGGVTVQNNARLENVSFPALTDCEGSLQLINNDQLGGTLDFPQLTTLRGSLNLTGAFTGVTMPEINLIAGTSTIYSTSMLGDVCQKFGSSGSLAGGTIKGKPINCKGTTSSAGTSTNGGSGTSSGAAVPMGVVPAASLFGATGLLAAMFGMM